MRAIIIGGGIAGVSLARCLAAKGAGVTVLEKAGQLCAGATWHAAGLVTRFGGSSKLKKVHVRSLELLNALHEAHDVGLHRTGSIRLIPRGETDRLAEARQHVAMARLYDDPSLPTTLIGAAEVAALHPLVDVSGVECGVYTPKDGDVDPTMLTTCLSKLAAADGAAFRMHSEVREVRRVAAGFEVLLAPREAGEAEVLHADAVVNCAGLWSRRFSAQLGMAHPAYVIEHQYAISESLPQLRGRLAEGERVPVLRDLKGSAYVRQERDGLLVGPYERRTTVHTEWPHGPPHNFAFDLFPPALERIEECLLSVMDVIPALQTVGIRSIVNGPTIWTGDSLARCGRTRVPGYFDFNSLTYGIAQSLALSEYLAHIMLEGEQPYDMATEFDPLRYGGWATEAYAEAKIVETYSHNNAVVYPHENRPAGRDGVHHPPGRRALYEALKAKGALFGFSNSGVEVPIAYLGNEAITTPPCQKTFSNHAWAPFAEKEATHVLEGVGLGYSSFSKLRVSSGASAAASLLLEHATTNHLPKLPGRCRLSYATTRAGRLLAEFTITRDGTAAADFRSKEPAGVPHDFYLVGSRDYAQHDLAWLEQRRDALVAAGQLAPGEVILEDLTDDVEILHLAGPKSEQMMAALCPEAAGVPFLQMRPLEVCGVHAKVFRISFTGEAGFELHVAVDDAAPLWHRIWSHPAASQLGLLPFGGQAVNALRIEKGFRVKADLDYSHWTEGGVEPFVALRRKEETHRFLGRDAPPPAGKARRAATFRVHTTPAHAWSVPGDSPVLDAAGGVVGVTTTSARGASTGRTLALGFVMCDEAGAPRAAPGDEGLVVECYGHKWPLELLEAPPVAVGGRPAPGGGQ
ncbi:hypothetical protein AB1Y20_013590 [Prymnesium parvum]|uniref:Dimethylglycine dehydrogenase n=1 Tax=Prymnesium parvum TaxID=97485 RepID=A0AB34IGQ2_PRYPA